MGKNITILLVVIVVIVAAEFSRQVHPANEPLAYYGYEFDIEHGQVAHHTNTDLEEHGISLPHGRQHGVPYVVPPSEIKQQTYGDEGVA